MGGNLGAAILDTYLVPARSGKVAGMGLRGKRWMQGTVRNKSGGALGRGAPKKSKKEIIKKILSGCDENPRQGGKLIMP